MRSNSSKPSSDAGLRAIGGFSSIAAATAQTSPESLGCSLSFFDRQSSIGKPTQPLDGAPQGADLGTHAVGRGGNPVIRGHGTDGIHRQGVALPSLHFRFVANCDGASVVSLTWDHEGIFLYVWPFELALLRPGVQA